MPGSPISKQYQVGRLGFGQGQRLFGTCDGVRPIAAALEVKAEAAAQQRVVVYQKNLLLHIFCLLLDLRGGPLPVAYGLPFDSGSTVLSTLPPVLSLSKGGLQTPTA
jgi:hypothetical protein